MTNYERILEALLEYTDDPALGLDILRKAQIETIAEIATDEVNEIVREASDAIKAQLQDALDLIGD